ncbi:mothers against decapentaplegic homolog 7-like isoform X4 [Columba livia]|uniref:mothers against decapentaplegic homolog 7-like isoform X4 n=1 Tax=Columba livia TaxID=8932 RepID=UPI0031BB7F1C
MFRTKRSVLVRRLWRNRAPGGEEEEEAAAGEPGGGAAAAEAQAHVCGGGRGCCPGKANRGSRASAGAEAELKALIHAVLKRLKERQLEGLLHAVESRGGARTPCLLLPAKADSRLGQHWYPLPMLLCKVFRWPDLRHCSEVKRLRCCESYGKAHPELVCCNPHHLSRLCELESPPPPYSRYPMDFLKPTDCPDSVPSSTETGGTNCLAPGGLSGPFLALKGHTGEQQWEHIPKFFRSQGISHNGAWWHTGKRRRAWVGCTLSKSPPWISSMIYLRGMVSASDSSTRTTKANWCRKSVARLAMASSSPRKWMACGCTTAAVTPSLSSRPHWTTPILGRCWFTKCSQVFPSRLLTMRRHTACRDPTTMSSCSNHGLDLLFRSAL